MSIVDPAKLEEIIKASGVGARTAGDLRKANKAQEGRPRGSGAARDISIPTDF